MPFRDREVETALVVEPFGRFQELLGAFQSKAGFFTDKVPLRLAAATLVTTPGDPHRIGEAITARNARLDERLGWFSHISGAIRTLVAATLVRHDDDADDFVDELERVQPMFRDVKLRRGGAYEGLATLALRIRKRGEAITSADIERFRDIYEALKTHHWFLTGPEDFPACAFFVGEPGTPMQIADKAEAIYQALRTEAGLWSGDPLQTASNVLALSGLEPQEISRRFRLMAEAFKAAGRKVRQPEYDEVALLCFLARPIDKIVESVMDYDRRAQDELGWTGKSLSFPLAASLAFVRLIGHDPKLGPLADAKTLLDMMAIVQQRQAAAAGAAAAGQA